MNLKLGCVSFCCALSVVGFAAHNVSTVDELVTAITAINNGDGDKTIKVAPGYYDVSACAMDGKGCLSIMKQMTIEGTDATCWRDAEDRNTEVVIDAKYARSVFNVDATISSVKMNHLTIQNGTNSNSSVVDGAGAGIQHGWYKGVYVTCSNCVFRNNMTPNQGGAGHTLNVYNCYFTNNVAREGGAILATSAAKDCLFEYNRSSGNGGALRNGGGISNCVFIGNVGGNGSCNYAGTYTVDGCVCISNSAAARGCFTSDSYNLTVKNSRFEGNRNTVANQGGAITWPKLVTNCVFVGNLSPKAGGAIYAPSNVAQIVHCSFTNNVCSNTSDGGGAVAGDSAATKQPFIRGCDFYGNSATNNGGAVLYGVLSNCTFTTNVAQYGSAASACSVTDCTFTDCVARQSSSTGFGGTCHGGAVTNCVFVNCSGAYGGGGNGTEMTNCTFIGCHALMSGGAAYNSILSDCVVSNCTAVSYNAAAGVGSETKGRRMSRVKFVDCQCATNNIYAISAINCNLEDCEFLRCNPGDNISATRCRVVGNGLFQRVDLMRYGAWTNCLVSGIVASYVFNSAKLVNCTVVSNNWGSTGQLFAGQTMVVNCIIKDNYHGSNGNGNWDIAGYGHWYMTNCVFKTHPNWSAYTFHDVGTITNTTGLFLASSRPDYDAQNPYALAPASPARNAGVAVVWEDGATDLIGNPRVFLKDDVAVVDIGCYEYSRLSPGTIMIFR